MAASSTAAAAACLGTRTDEHTHILYNINSLLYKKEYERNLRTENCPNGSICRIVTINISPRVLLPFNCILFLLLRSNLALGHAALRISRLGPPSRMIQNDPERSRAAHACLQLVS